VNRLLQFSLIVFAFALYGMGVFIISVASGSRTPAAPATSAAPAAQILSPTTEISVHPVETTTSTQKPIVRRAMTKPTAPGVGYGGVGAR
jgi:hypothetical protein